jgi:diaminopimelate decarboxylase
MNNDLSGPDPTPAELVAARAPLAWQAMEGLLLEGVPLNAIADALGTPTWVYAAGVMRARYRALAAALEGLAGIHYAVKANDHLAVLRLFATLGAGADVVSGGELARTAAAGIAASRVIFSGVGKTVAELRAALAAGIGQINVESAEELAMISAIASAMGREAPVALRVNPDIDAGTHPKITTGRHGNKFGIPFDAVPALYAHAARLPGLRPVGLAVHIGSQITTAAPYRAALDRIAGLVRDLRAAGERVTRVDCGGGLGIAYRHETPLAPEILAGVLRAALGGLDLALVVEPGRWLVGPAGVLLASVVLVKDAAPRPFVVLDAAMNDLLRPALYDAWHGIVPLAAKDAKAAPVAVDVVGPVCESGDIFAAARPLPPLVPGARVAILDGGAYGAVMSSTYNARPLAAAAMIDGTAWAVIRARQSEDDLWRGEIVPGFAETPG